MNPAKPSKPIGTGSLRRSDSPEENAAWDKYFDYLLKSLRDPEPNARIRAAQILGDNRDPRAVEALGEALGDPDAGVRQNATIALGKIGAPALDALIAALQDPDRDVRQFAAKALGQIGDPRGIAGLVIALHDTQMDVRSQAAFALSRIGAPAVDALITALQDPDANVRANAARILGQTLAVGGQIVDEPMRPDALGRLRVRRVGIVNEKGETLGALRHAAEGKRR